MIQVDERELLKCGRALERALAVLNRLFNLKEGVNFSDIVVCDPLATDEVTWESLGRGFIAVEPDQTYGADAG